jgi:hypothetical protein
LAYRQTGGDERETVSDFFQSYRLGLGEGLNYSPSHAISAQGSISYSNSQSGDERNLSGRDNLTPAGQLSLVNDIFIAQLSGSTTYTKNSSGTYSDHSSWEYSLLSAWDIPFWPKLGFNYSEQNESGTFDEFTFFNDPTLTSKSRNFTYSWDLALAKFDYAYSDNTTEDIDTATISESDSHFARLETGGKFWENRLGFNLSQQFTKSSANVEFSGDGEFDFPLEGAVTLSAVTDPNVLPDPPPTWLVDDVGLQNNSGLGNGFFADIPVPLEGDSGDRVHLAINFDRTQQIDFLRISLETATSDQAAAALQWDLYIPDPSGTLWELVAINIPAAYDPIEKRIELQINLFESSVMVVAVNTSTELLGFTELEAFSSFESDRNKSDSTSYRTNFNSSYRIHRTLNANFNLKLDHDEFDSGGNDITNDRLTYGGSLRWVPVPSFRPSVSYSESQVNDEDQPEEISRTYSLGVSTLPLPAMNVSFTATRNERYSGGLKYLITDRYSLVTRGQIYPDLTASWLISHTNTEAATEDDGRVLSNKTYSTRLDLAAQLTRNLAADLVPSWRLTEDDDRTQSGDVRFGLRYRPSDLLSMRGDYTTFFGDLKREDSYNLSMNLRLVQTDKTRLLFTATRNKANQTTDNFGLDGNWNISRNLFMRSRLNYRMGETNAYSFQVNLTLSL